MMMMVMEVVMKVHFVRMNLTNSSLRLKYFDQSKEVKSSFYVETKKCNNKKYLNSHEF